MNRAGLIMLGLCFALLLLLGGQSLVEGPDMAEIPPVSSPLPMLPGAYLAEPVEASAQTADALLTGQPSGLRRYAIREDAQAQTPAVSPLCDRNGWPMTGRSYARTVYTACPLENMPG